MNQFGIVCIVTSQLGMLDLLMWPWFERLPVFTHMNLPVPHFPGLNAYQQAMWNTGNRYIDR